MIRVLKRVHKNIASLAARLKEFLGDRLWMFAVFAVLAVPSLFFLAWRSAYLLTPPALLPPNALYVRRPTLRLVRQLAITLGLLTPANLDDVSRGLIRNMIMDEEGGAFWFLIHAPFLILVLLSAIFVVWGINRGIREDERDGTRRGKA